MTADAVGGIWTYAADLAAALVAQGTDVLLAVLGPGLDTAKQRAGVDAGFSIVDLGHQPEWLADGPDAVRRGGAALASLASDWQPDVIHLNHPALSAGMTFSAPVLTVAHSCVATWWSTMRGTPLPPDLRWQADLVAAGYRSATQLVAPSRAFARVTEAAYALGRAPEVVFNGRSRRTSNPAGLPVRSGLTVGRLWDEGKDAETLDRAAASTSVPIQAVGPTRGPNGACVALHHLDATGSASEGEIRAMLADRPVYLSAARYEPFGLSVLEAAQAGCALVLSDIATFRELWADAALFIPIGDAPAFAAALDRLVDEPSLRQRLGAAAHNRAGRYTLAATVARLLVLYSAVLDRDRASPDRRASAPAAPMIATTSLGGQAA